MSTASTIRDHVHKIHVAINDGSLDRDTANASLKELTTLADDLEGAGTKPSKPLPKSVEPAVSTAASIGSPAATQSPPAATPSPAPASTSN